MSDDPNSPSNHARRITALEELLTHCERMLGDLNAVILQQQSRLAAMEQRLAQVISEVDTVSAQSEPPRRLEDDKPPHY